MGHECGFVVPMLDQLLAHFSTFCANSLTAFAYRQDELLAELDDIEQEEMDKQLVELEDVKLPSVPAGGACWKSHVLNLSSFKHVLKACWKSPPNTHGRCRVQSVTSHARNDNFHGGESRHIRSKQVDCRVN